MYFKVFQASHCSDQVLSKASFTKIMFDRRTTNFYTTSANSVHECFCHGVTLHAEHWWLLTTSLLSFLSLDVNIYDAQHIKFIFLSLVSLTCWKDLKPFIPVPWQGRLISRCISCSTAECSKKPFHNHFHWHKAIKYYPFYRPHNRALKCKNVNFPLI